MIVKFCNVKKTNWDDVLNTCVFAYNTSCHESTLYTPFEIMFGRKAILPIDFQMHVDIAEKVEEPFNPNASDIERITDERIKVLKQAKANIQLAQKKQKLEYDRKHANPKAYELGAKVLKKDFKRKKRRGGKLDYKYVGPFTITKCLGKGLYSLQSIENPDVVIKSVNGVHIKPYLTPHSTFSTHSSSNSSSYTPPVDKSVLHKTELVLSSGDSFHKRGDSSASSPTSKSQHSKESEATLQHLSASKQHMEEHYYADNHLSNVQDDGNPLYAWKCVTYTLEGCKSESLNVFDHESTQMGDLAFVLESSKHITVPELPNPHSEMVTSTPTLSGGYFTPMEDGNLSPIPVCNVLSHYKESCTFHHCLYPKPHILACLSITGSSN